MKRLRAEFLARFCMLAGRVLILLSAVLLAVTPMTAHFWTFDRFLRGGQDFEMGLLSVLAVMCLVLLLADSFRKTISLLIALRNWIAHSYAAETSAGRGRMFAFRSPEWAGVPTASLCPGAFLLPLLI